MLRIFCSRSYPYVLQTVIRNSRSCTVDYRYLSTEILPVQRDVDDENQRREFSTPHHELVEVLDHRSTQLQWQSIRKLSGNDRVSLNRKDAMTKKKETLLELAKPKGSKTKAKKKPVSNPVKTPDRIRELSEKLQPASSIPDPLMPYLEEEEGSEDLSIEETLSLPTLDDLTLNEDDQTLNDILNNLHSNKTRRIHKYTDEQLLFMHKHNEFNRMLQAYIDVSIHNGQLKKMRRFLDDLIIDQERRKSMKHLNWRYISSVNVYNSFFFAYAETGNLRDLQSLFEKMRKSHVKPNLESYAACLSCLGEMDLFDSTIARRMIVDLENNGYRVVDIFNLDCLNHEHIRRIGKVLKTFRPDFDIPERSSEVKNPLLTNIYQTPTVSLPILENPWWKDIDQQKKLDEQLSMEIEQKVKLRSINKFEEIDENLKKNHQEFMKQLEKQLTLGFITELAALKSSTKKDFSLSIVPFLEIFDASEYVQFMMKDINQHFYASEFFSSPLHNLYIVLGRRLYQKYLCTVRRKNGFIDKLRLVYDDYMSHVMSHGRFQITERQKWNEIVKEKSAYMDRNDRPWSYTQMLKIGEFLYNIMLKHMKLRGTLLSKERESTNRKGNDAVLFAVYRTPGNFLEKQIKVHPIVLNFFSQIPQTELEFDCTELPCVAPPLPWLSPAVGGYLLNQTDFVRLPISANEQINRLRALPSEKIGGLFDSINTLNSCAWKMNTEVLDLLIDVFQRGGSRQLSVSVSVENAKIDEPLPIEKGITMQERKRRESALALTRKLKAEVYSLWCNELYRLSIANHFRKEIFWFPHNMDFRGRVYPVPPHFNHLGSDVARSIILFAEGKPLGSEGLRHLKIHLINLTDLKKKASIDERAKYADEMMDEILDSADRPLTGRQWWAKSEEPWQTLACCMEIARAIRSPDPTQYISHFPVHQDGSCNVLQHYAAMGLDDIGAASVNLKPNKLPQDVYSVVVDQVEQERAQDAANGVQIAKILQGFVKRKVIKQTIMTTNYGVTMFGARQQISRQLRDIDEFPKQHVAEASTYLAQKTFLSLRELFRETRRIQDWFTDCASLISRIRGTPVEWNTPMNLPVIQPYYREMRHHFNGTHVFDNFSSFGRPNHIKQKNAFPPNYVHSLDSTHMMLTALQCARNGITFVSVHDSFWTHACDVDRLGQFCRQQFVALHREPLLEILSQDFLSKFEFKASEMARSDRSQRETMKHLNDTLRRVPERGSFRLDSVLESTYFFS